MVKNLMSEVAKLLGLHFNENFKVQGLAGEGDMLEAYLDETGLHFVDFIVCNDAEYKYLAKMLTGELEYEKLPWEPKDNERYFYPAVFHKEIRSASWDGCTDDYAMKLLGMIYRTREEAEAHFAEDYERLTGKKLEV